MNPRPFSAVSRAGRHGLLGAGLALGAPLGLLVLRVLERGGPQHQGAWSEILANPWTYAYVTLSTLVAFGAFGYLLGRQADRLYELSHSDPLTGLRNRRAFEARLGEELQRALRYRSQLSVLLLDVDGLKRHNDRLGHRAGDEALVRVADAIRNGSRQTDVAARWGGDEFAILAPSTGREEALQLAERVRELAASPEAGLSVSVG
ncbi:MAG TPA: GGDEF domain-containing protein, partial [Vicinamibacteria bacterium]